MDEKDGWGSLGPGRELGPQEVAAAARRLLPGWTVAAQEKLSGGLCNLNYKVTFHQSNEPLLLRIYLRDPEACKREIKLLELLKDQIPVARVIAGAPEDSLLGPHVWQEFIHGITFRELRRRRDSAEISAASASIGEALASVGRFRFDGQGFLGPELELRAFPGAAVDPLKSFVEMCLENENLARWLDPVQRSRVLEWLDTHRWAAPTLSTDTNLVHGDFNSANILVREDQRGRWQLAAFLDWEFAFSASSLFDIGNFLRYEQDDNPRVEPAFSRAYRENGGVLPEQWRMAARMADLSSLLEILTRDRLPDNIGEEVAGLVLGTLACRAR